MRNFLVLGVAAICTVVMVSDSATAALGGNGGGKAKSRAKFIFHNVQPSNGIGVAIWTRSPGTPLPATLGELRDKLIYVGPGEIRQTSKLKNGQYVVSYGNAASTAGDPDTPISEDDVDESLINTATYTLNGKDIVIDVGGPMNGVAALK